jgi:hypothetical protein
MLAVFTETKANTSAAPVIAVAGNGIGRSWIRTLHDECFGVRLIAGYNSRTQSNDPLTINDTERELGVASRNADGV